MTDKKNSKRDKKSMQKTRPGLSSQPTNPAKPVELSDKELEQVVGGTHQYGGSGGSGKTDASSNVV